MPASRKKSRATFRRLDANVVLGRALKAELTLLGITQVDICQETGLHPQTINRALNHGLGIPTIHVIEAIIAREKKALAAA